MARQLRLLLSFILLNLAGVLAASAQIADFNANAVSGCAPLVVQFSDASTGAITSYSWNFGNSGSSSLQNPSTTYTSPGIYTVSLTVSGPTGSHTETKNGYITVYDKPAISFTANNLAGCTPHSTQFITTVTPNAPGPVTYSWNFGDGTIDTGAAPSHIYTVAGIYTVSVTATNGAGCSQTAVRNAYVTAYPVPIVNFNSSLTYFCSTPTTTVFNNTSTSGTSPFTYAWTFGDLGTSNASSPTHSYTSGGSYNVGLTITDSKGCVGQLTRQNYIVVNDTPANFSIPSDICLGTPIGVANSKAWATNTTWNFGDGNTGIGNATGNLYAATGTYNVTMTTFFSGCWKTVTKTINVHPKPSATITKSPAFPCPAPVNVSFTASSSLGTRFDWVGTDGLRDSGQSISKTYTTNAQHEVYLITTTAHGCKDTTLMDTVFIRDIEVHIHPDKNWPPPGGLLYAFCSPATIEFEAPLHTFVPLAPPPVHNAYPIPANSWLWDFGDGSAPSTQATPTHFYGVAGNYTVKCIVTTPNGCIDSAYRDMHADTPVHPSFTTNSPRTICPNTPVTFINTTDSILSPTVFIWAAQCEQDVNIGDELPKAPNDTSSWAYNFPSSGTYTVRLITNHLGCIDSMIKMAYVSVSPPFPKFRDSVYCNPSTTVKYTNLSVGTTSQLWDFGDGTTDTSFSPVHSFPDTGVYSVKLIVYNSANGCTDTLVKNDTLYHSTIDFSFSDSAVCINQTVFFTGQYNSRFSHQYGWRFDNFYTSFEYGNQTSYAFNGTTGYKDVVLYILSGNNCVDSLIKPNAILVAQPDVKFGVYPSSGCAPLSVLLVDSSTNAPGVHTAQRFWKFGDNDSVFNNIPTVTHAYDTGSYSVYLRVTDSLGCISQWTDSTAVRVHAAYADFTVGKDSACIGEAVLFTSTSFSTTSRLYHYWDFGDGSTDTGWTPQHQYVAPGFYNVRLIVIDSAGCTDTLIKTNAIHIVKPLASFTMSDSISVCPPFDVTFTNTTIGATSYTWDFGAGGGLAHVTNPINSFTAAGVYHVVMVAQNDNGCTDTATAVVKVLGYNGAFTYSPLEGCVPMLVQFSAAVTNVAQITWDFDDGNVITTTTTSTPHIYTTRGSRVPKVIFSDGKGCTSPSVGLQTIKVDEVYADFNWSVPCAGTAFTLNDSSSGFYNTPDAWHWIFGTDSDDGKSVSYTFNTSGNHAVTLIASNSIGCKDTITKDVFINPLPIVDAGPNQGVCPDDSTIFTATGAQSYNWTPAQLVICQSVICDAVQVWTKAPTTYYVIGTDSNGCKNKDSAIAFIQIKTETHVGKGGEICEGESFQLEASGATRYSWTPAASLNNAGISSPIASPIISTTYILEAQKGSCLIAYDTIKVIVHPSPVFDAGFDESINLGMSVTLHARKNGIDHIIWKQDTTLSCVTCFDPVAKPYYTRVYYATGYDQYGCSATDSVTVFVRCNGSLVFIPNTFTPNGDGNNDYFYPRGEGVGMMGTFRVFNRWGEIVFERKNVALNDEHSGWDGTYRGQPLAPDVFTYTMQATCEDGKTSRMEGRYHTGKVAGLRML